MQQLQLKTCQEGLKVLIKQYHLIKRRSFYVRKAFCELFKDDKDFDFVFQMCCI